jgi:hypothetical protein
MMHHGMSDGINGFLLSWGSQGDVEQTVRGRFVGAVFGAET